MKKISNFKKRIQKNISKIIKTKKLNNNILWFWEAKQKNSIEDFLEKVTKEDFSMDNYIGCVKAGDLCFDLVVNECDEDEYKLFADLYVSGVASGYAYMDDGTPYDFFSDVECCWDVKKFKNMNYYNFTKFIEKELTKKIKSTKESFGSDGKKYDIIEKANKELAHWW